MTEEIVDGNGVPQRCQYPHLSYRGYLREKYDYLSQHPARPGLNHVYLAVLGALNDSTTEQARDYLRNMLRIGNGGEDVYQEALRELDEEERERNALLSAD